MTSDIVALVDYYEKEKGVDPEKVMAALQYAFLQAYRKMIPGAEGIENLRADVDSKKGDITIYATLTVVEDGLDDLDHWNEIVISVAKKRKESIEVGDSLDFNVTPQDFGRISVQAARQAMMQRLRYAEKEMMYDEYKDRAGDIVSGTVRRFEKNDVWVDLGKFEGRMPSRERVITEDYNIGDQIRAYVVEVENESRGPEVILSRSHPNFVRRLFEAEVSEIADRTVEIHGIAREAGYRTKVAVRSDDENIDPVGACVGLRGARVKNIVRELNNEKVDIIPWSDDTEEFVHEALKPAILKTVQLDPENKVVCVTVEEEELSKAIGRRGQNARLTAKLLGWEVEIRKDESQHEQFEAKITDASHGISEQLEISAEVADRIFRAGGVSIDLILQMPATYLSSVIDGSEAEAEGILVKAAATQQV